MKYQRARMLYVVLGITLVSIASVASAQMPGHPAAGGPVADGRYPMPHAAGYPGAMPPGGAYGPPPGMMGPPPGMMGPPPGMMGPPPGMMGGPYGPGPVAPASYHGMPMDQAMPGGDYYDPTAVTVGCTTCGGGGCPNCMGGPGGMGPGGAGMSELDYYRGVAWNVVEWLLPYEGGGACEQRWYDLRLEAFRLQRDETDRVDFTSEGVAGPIVLSTDNLELDDEWGMRLNFALMVGPGSDIEFDYFGLHNWADSARVTSDTDNLFSAFSNFGTDPFGGFQETDQAFLHQIEYSSELSNFELNYRRRWVGPFCRFQGSWLFGIRYLQLEEDFIFRSRTDNGQLDYQVETENSLTGPQLGGDLWASLLPGVRIGTEWKAGIFGNDGDQATRIDATTLGVPIFESAEDGRVSYISEGGIMMTYRPVYQLTLRAGYHWVYIHGVALAPENFNAAPPFLAGARNPTIDDNGEVFYHGSAFGAEYRW